MRCAAPAVPAAAAGAEACRQHPANVVKLKTRALNVCLDEGVEQRPSTLGVITTHLCLKVIIKGTPCALHVPDKCT